jgi:hypothetical protein
MKTAEGFNPFLYIGMGKGKDGLKRLPAQKSNYIFGYIEKQIKDNT